MSRTPPHTTTLVGLAQRVWSGQICNLSHLRVFILSFLLFLTDRDDLYAKTRVFGQGRAFRGLDNIRLHLGVKLPKKPSPNGRGIHISQPYRQSIKLAICRWSMKIFAYVKFHIQIDYRANYRKKCKIRSKGCEGVMWPTFRIVGPPPYLGNGWR